MLSASDIAVIVKQLGEEELGLTESLAQSQEAAAAVELDQTVQGRLSRMDALRAQEMAKATLQRKQTRLKQVKAAIHRIDQDDFGYCADCGNDIAVARLQFNPCATLCVACAEAREA